ncbi:MAG: AI-2E family transporter [Clostridia bacterium]|nr:AI-2E family transporter [Clostridia bacterium]
MSTTQKKRFTALSLFFLAMLMLFAILHRERLNVWLGSALFVLRPVLIGLVLAYLCNPIFRTFERKVFASVRPLGFRRVLSLILTYAVLFLIFFTLLMLIVPQLINSVMDFLTNYEAYIANAIQSINGLIDGINDTFSSSIPSLDAAAIQKSIGNFFANLNIQSFLEGLLTYSNISALVAHISDLFYLIADIFLGIFISIYILSAKEKQYAQLSRLRHAIFTDTLNRRLTRICTIADKSFGGFLRGKLLDSTIVGVLVFVLISILKVPYPLLIAVVIAITDIVPIIGPFVGVIPSAIIVLLTDPIKVIPFLLCILLVQQIDGNIIAPKILGENTGVSSLCVMIAITVLGAIWGFVGMIVAVPLFATILELTGGFLEKRLRDKGLPVETKHYYGAKTETKATVSEPASKKSKKKAARKKEAPIGGTGTLSDAERDRLHAYTLACRHGLMRDCTKEALERFAQELYPPTPETNADAPANEEETDSSVSTVES